MKSPSSNEDWAQPKLKQIKFFLNVTFQRLPWLTLYKVAKFLLFFLGISYLPLPCCIFPQSTIANWQIFCLWFCLPTKLQILWRQRKNLFCDTHTPAPRHTQCGPQKEPIPTKSISEQGWLDWKVYGKGFHHTPCSIQLKSLSWPCHLGAVHSALGAVFSLFTPDSSWAFPPPPPTFNILSS